MPFDYDLWFFIYVYESVTGYHDSTHRNNTIQWEGSRLRIKASGFKADRVASRMMCPHVHPCTAVMVATSCFLLESEALLHKREFTLGAHEHTAKEVLAPIC